jgi:small subunit ribosomal protein S6
MNIECDNDTLAELENAFKFNDAVLRHLTVKVKQAVTVPSPMMKEEKSRSLTPAAPAAPAAAVDAPAAPVEAAAAA